MKTVEIACIVGARPNFIKMAAILDALGRRPRFRFRLIHTAQHFSPEMSAVFFDELGLPQPDVNLGASGATANEQTADIMRKLEPELVAQRPDLLLVVGDVNSTLAAALVASKLLIPIAHVEAGLRSGDRTMPEEINRIVVDAISDLLFVSEPSGVENLRREGRPEDAIFLVGNVMIDTLLRFRDRAAESDVLAEIGLRSGEYVAATLHRPANVDAPEQLAELLQMLRRLSERFPVVFPVHPRTRARIESAGLPTDGIRLTAPLGYLDFLCLLDNARLVLTDSGGIQEETTILNTPCLTVRDNTERPVTITCGTNRLVGTNPPAVYAAAMEALESAPSEPRQPEGWDGRAAERIVDVLEQHFGD